jgi:hypothetical protein
MGTCSSTVRKQLEDGFGKSHLCKGRPRGLECFDRFGDQLDKGGTFEHLGFMANTLTRWTSNPQLSRVKLATEEGVCPSSYPVVPFVTRSDMFGLHTSYPALHIHLYMEINTNVSSRIKQTMTSEMPSLLTSPPPNLGWRGVPTVITRA